MNFNTIIITSLVSSLVWVAVKPISHALPAQLSVATTDNTVANIADLGNETLPNDLGTIIFHHKVTRDADANIVTDDLITIKKTMEPSSLNFSYVNSILSRYE